MRNTCLYPGGEFGEICGYADVPNPEFPGELEVGFENQVMETSAILNY